jgi:predicted DNA-binding mobile mystery protein A
MIFNPSLEICSFLFNLSIEIVLPWGHAFLCPRSLHPRSASCCVARSARVSAPAGLAPRHPRDAWHAARRTRAPPGVSGQAVANLEGSEADGSIRLDSLRRAAEALDCKLVYALVPNASLDEIVDRRAHEIARRQVGRVQHTMLLEDQRGGDEDVERLIDELAEQAKQSPALWRE